jgi:cellulose biosynthesis protein BcsQ
MKLVAFFNHKGGVGKTTIVFHTALALGAQGRRVLMVDADSQANLTGAALSDDDIEAVIKRQQTIWNAVAPLVTGAGDLVYVDPLRLRDAVWLLPGDVRLAEYENICPNGWVEALAGQERGFRVSTALYRLAIETGARVQADVVFLDLGPNVNALNRTALMAADGFVVPLAPDLFSVMALPNVGSSVARWVNEWSTARTVIEGRGGLNFPLPAGMPTPLGYLSQQFSVYRKEPSAAFRKWLTKIPAAYDEGVVRPLQAVGLRPPEGNPELEGIPNFYSLIPLAQEAHKAMFELTGAEARGAQYTKATETRDTFLAIGAAILNRLS